MSSIKVEDILRPEKRKKFDSDENSVPASKMPKLETDAGDADAGVDTDLLKALEQQEIEPVDETSIKRMILNFEKRMLKNQEHRVKFADQPDKFMESEIDLSVSIQEMHAIATVPSLYPLLTEMDAVRSLLQLLLHENTDITICVVDLLQELTDVDTLNESEEGAEVLVDALLDGQVIGLLVQNMEKLNESEKDESDGVHNSLRLVENLTEFKPEVCVTAVEQGLLTWLLKRVKVKGSFDGNKLYASEILAIVLQNANEAKKAFGEQDGVDILLQQLSSYKRHNPASLDEIEYMENLFNCLCAALLYAPNRGKFLAGEGLQLMNLMLREKKLSRASALKVLDYATNGKDGRENCDKFVEILGLRTLFPLFLKTPSKHHRKGHTAEEHEEHSTAIIASLLKSCNPGQRQRVLAKFVEGDYLKVDRLMELHFKYVERVRRFEQKFMEESRANDEELDEEELYMLKLDAGLFTLQIIDYIIADIVAYGSSGIRERAVKCLNMRGGSLRNIKNILREYANSLGDQENDKATDSSHHTARANNPDQQRILHIIDKL